MMQAAKKNSSKLARAWFYVPLGITIILAVCFGVDSIFYKFNVSFPASVTCMMLLFFALIASESLLGTHKTRKLVSIIDVPVSHGHWNNDVDDSDWSRLAGHFDGWASSSRRLSFCCL
jgi:cell division protein FtsL